MDLFKEFINQYGVTILYTVLTALAGYIGIAIKKVYTKYINDKTKRDVANTCVRAVQQIYADLGGHEKLQKCIEAASEMLEDKGIHVTSIELRMLIESAVNEFKDAFNREHEVLIDEMKVGELPEAEELEIIYPSEDSSADDYAVEADAAT